MDLFKKLIEQETGETVELEFRFHPVRRWRIDYSIPALKIAIEIEGGAWTKGRHTRGTGFIKDMEKYNTMMLLDWALLRFTPDQKLKTETIEMIKDLVNQRRNLNLYL